MSEAFIVAAARTAGGRRGGRLRGWHPVDLGAAIIDALVERAGVPSDRYDDVILGCVTQIGEQAFNVARNAVIVSKLPDTVPGVTIDRQCGSSQQALHFAAQAVMSGSMDVVLAGGVESMTRAPMNSAASLAMDKGMGNPLSPGLLNNRPNFEYNQFRGAEMMASKYELSKEELDSFALASHRNAAGAAQAGRFDAEIVPVEAIGVDGGGAHEVDEGIRFDTSLEAIQGVRRLQEGGVLTAASSSQICDGASGVVVVSERALKSFNLTPLARVHYMGVLGGDPVIMLEAPIPATERALERSGLGIGDIDLYEVNEAFASVPLAWVKALDADPARLNVKGGAIALGHPLGASGTRLATTLIHALGERKARYGLQTMCEGGGLANVTVFERL